jgi:hypothetical protein
MPCCWRDRPAIVWRTVDLRQSAPKAKVPDFFLERAPLYDFIIAKTNMLGQTHAVPLAVASREAEGSLTFNGASK